MDSETREALDKLGADLRCEIRSSVLETGAYMDDRIQASTVRLLSQSGELKSLMRRNFDVLAFLLGGDIHGLAEFVSLSRGVPQRFIDEQAERTERFEGRVLRLEVRISSLNDDQKPRDSTEEGSPAQ